MSQARFQKQQREKARRERAAAKFAKKTERAAEGPAPEGPTRDQATVLAELAQLHERFDAGEMEFEDFEEAKQRLVEDLDVR